MDAGGSGPPGKSLRRYGACRAIRGRLKDQPGKRREARILRGAYKPPRWVRWSAKSNMRGLCDLGRFVVEIHGLAACGLEHGPTLESIIAALKLQCVPRDHWRTVTALVMTLSAGEAEGRRMMTDVLRGEKTEMPRGLKKAKKPAPFKMGEVVNA